MILLETDFKTELRFSLRSGPCTRFLGTSLGGSDRLPSRRQVHIRVETGGNAPESLSGNDPRVRFNNQSGRRRDRFHLRSSSCYQIPPASWFRGRSEAPSKRWWTPSQTKSEFGHGKLSIARRNFILHHRDRLGQHCLSCVASPPSSTCAPTLIVAELCPLIEMCKDGVGVATINRNGESPLRGKPYGRASGALNSKDYAGLRAVADAMTIRLSARLRATFFIFSFAPDPIRR